MTPLCLKSVPAPGALTAPGEEGPTALVNGLHEPTRLAAVALLSLSCLSNVAVTKAGAALCTLCRIGASLTKTSEALDVVDGVGETHNECLRSAKWDVYERRKLDPTPYVQPWTSVIQQTLNHQEAPEYFQKDNVMKQTVEILDDEEVFQTTTCTPKDVYRLDVEWDVHENTLDLKRVALLPGKAVMVKKPNGDGTRKKKARVVGCGNFQHVQPGEETCANTPSFLLPYMGGQLQLGCVKSFLVCSLPEGQAV